MHGDVHAGQNFVLGKWLERVHRDERPRHRAADEDEIVAVARIVADHLPHFADRLVRRPIDDDAHAPSSCGGSSARPTARSSDRGDTARRPENAR